MSRASLPSPALLAGTARLAVLLEPVFVQLDDVGPGGDVGEC